MGSGAILSGAYAARIEAVKALRAATDRRVDNGAHLRTLAGSLDEVATRYGDVRVAVAYSALASLMRTLAMLVDWRAAVLSAAIDADRYRRSARELHRAWCDEYGKREEAGTLAQAAAPISELDDTMGVGPLCEAIGSVPLPIGIYAEDTRRRIPRFDVDGKEDRPPPPPELTVAFIRFNVDGQPADQTHFLTPREAHDLEIEVRISRWPDHAEALTLSPVTIEARSAHDFPTFRFERPSGDPPIT